MATGTPMFTTDFLRALLGQDSLNAENLIAGFGADAYKRFDLMYKNVAEQFDTERPFVEIVMNKALPMASILPEGAQRTYNKMNQLWITNLYIQEYQSNYIMTWQLIKTLRSKSKIVAKILESTGERALALSIKEDNAFGQMMNAAESSAQVYGDGLPMCSQQQLTGDGSTYSNLAASSADISEYAVEAVWNVVSTWTDSGGKAFMPLFTKLLGGTHTKFDAERLLKTEFRLGTNYNDRNIVESNRLIPGGSVQSPHLSNDGSWFLLTNVKNGLQTHTFLHPEFDLRPTNQAYNSEVIGHTAFVHGIGDKRAVYRYPAA